MFFRNDYWFLSNFYETPIVVNGIRYRCVESAFQSFKTEDRELRKKFSNLSGSEAKKLGRKIKLRSDWNAIRLSVMKRLIEIKFSDETLKSKLLSIDEPIIEENTWGDKFWGVCNGIGKNNLGLILSEVRDNFRG